jgi:NAD(P)H-hydrate epimerase
LCGKGNNGGDGAALARILWNQGADVDVYLFGKVEDTKGDARINFESLQKIAGGRKSAEAGIYFEEVPLIDYWVHTTGFELEKYDVLIDALFGTGLKRPLNSLYRSLTEICSEKSAAQKTLNISIDIPSGLKADTSEKFTVWKERNRRLHRNTKSVEARIQFAEEVGGNIQADLTVTFTAPKLANVLPPASNFNGELVVANIGSPPELIDASPSQTFLAERQDALRWLEKSEFSSASYKNKRGHALLVAGSSNYAGAAVLAGNAAIVSGVGLVTIATARSAQDSIASRVLPEVMTRGVAETGTGAVAAEAFTEIDEFIEKSIDAVLIGSGLSSSEESTKNLVKKLVAERRTPVVIDADGLNSLAPFEIEGSDDLPLILTPHEGEFLKLLGTKDKEALKDRVAVVREFAVKHRVILVLKGERATVAAPDGRVVINPTGNSGLGKAGNGDTLAGIIAGFAAQAAQLKIDMFETTVAAVYLAGLAGDIAAEKFGKRSMLASDVRECLQQAFQAITD